jgi:metallo-beta-lactamase class B
MSSMKTIFLAFFIFFVLFPILLVAQKGTTITINDDVKLYYLEDSVLIHETWHTSETFGRFSSNGMIVISNGKAMMIDTPFDDEKTKAIVEFVSDSLSVEITGLIAGHYHDDCMGGLGYIKQKGIRSFANSLTIKKCKELGLPVPEMSFTDSLLIHFNGTILECRFMGAGHTFDNIIVWMPDYHILFGGCLVKSAQSQNLGNLNDAVVSDWDITLERIIKTYPEIKYVVPGHGLFGGKELLTHTLNLVDMQKGLK